MPMKKFRKVSPTYSGVQFNGTNHNEVREFLEGNSYESRHGGNWIKVQTPESTVPEVTITRGTWAMIESDTGELKTIADYVLEEDFKKVGGKRKPAYLKIKEPIQAIQLEGNAKEIGDILRAEGRVVRSSDRWVKFSDRVMRVGDWLIKHPESGGLSVMGEAEFSYMYTPTR